MARKNCVKIQIAGQEYYIDTDSCKTEQYIQSIADKVESEIKSLREQLPSMSIKDLVVLASLNFCDETKTTIRTYEDELILLESTLSDNNDKILALKQKLFAEEKKSRKLQDKVNEQNAKIAALQKQIADGISSADTAIKSKNQYTQFSFKDRTNS